VGRMFSDKSLGYSPAMTPPEPSTLLPLRSKSSLESMISVGMSAESLDFLWGTTRPHHSPGLISNYLAGKKKSQNKNFDDHTRTILLALIPKLTIATMEMFSSFDEFWATSKPKSGGAS
jgi:hypothetical protein